MNKNFLPIFSLSLALMGCTAIPKSDVEKLNTIEPTKKDFVKVTRGNVVSGQCPLGEIMLSISADGLAPSNRNYPDKLSKRHIVRPVEKVEKCAQLTGGIKVKTGDTVHIEIDANNHIKIIGKFSEKLPGILKFGTVLDGECQLGYALVQMRYRDDPHPSPLVQYFVEPQWSVRCLPVSALVEANPRSRVQLGIVNSKGDFGVVKAISDNGVKRQDGHQ